MDGQDGQADAGPSNHASSTAETPTYPSAPSYAFSSNPSSLLEVDASDLESELVDNFWRSARWAPDGSCILTTSEDRTIRLFDTPLDQPPDTSPRRIDSPDSVVSTAWYPLASASSPESFCFAASVRGCPVRLVDASNGRVRATYPIVDHKERVIAPWSMAFNSSATRLYCGHENAIEVLDIASPGYDSGERIKTTLTRRDKGGQKGIISALAFCPDYSGVFAAGSFAGSVSLYAEDTQGSVGHIDGVLGGGITQVAFHPLATNVLFVASRRSEKLLAFDTRNPSAPIMEYERPASTNQRLAFDVDPWGRWLAAGDETGVVRVWDISTMTDSRPLWQAHLHQDAISSVQFHPYRPILLTSSGSRAFHSVPSYDSDDSDDSDVSSESSDSEHLQVETNGERPTIFSKAHTADKRLCLYSFASSS